MNKGLQVIGRAPRHYQTTSPHLILWTSNATSRFLAGGPTLKAKDQRPPCPQTCRANEAVEEIVALGKPWWRDKTWSCRLHRGFFVYFHDWVYNGALQQQKSMRHKFLRLQIQQQAYGDLFLGHGRLWRVIFSAHFEPLYNRSWGLSKASNHVCWQW